MLLLLLLPLLFFTATNADSPPAAIQGTRCSRNQVVNKLTVYEDGAIEAECGPMPCGGSGERCIEDNAYCKAETDVFSGMKWAKNGQSLLLRCCSISGANKVYIGTDLVALGSYYTGGLVAPKDMSVKNGGPEYDFVTNLRTEQNGVRVWVYRIICPAGNSTVGQPSVGAAVAAATAGVNSFTSQKNVPFDEDRRQYLLKQIGESQDAPTIAIDSQTESGADAAAPAPAESEPSNPLQYRPRQSRLRDAAPPTDQQQHQPSERLL